MIKKNYFLMALLILVSTNIFSQAKQHEIVSKNKSGTPNFIKLKDTQVSSDTNSVKKFIKDVYNFKENITFKIKKNSTQYFKNIRTEKLQQYYKGIKVEFSELVTSSKDNKLETVSGNFLKIDDLNINPSLSESQALNSILTFINAEQYSWHSSSFENLLKIEQNNPNATSYPKGELIIIDRNLFDNISEPILVYKFNIYSLKPLSRSFYYVNSSNGKLILEDPIIKHIQGPADTRYSNTRTIETEQVGGQFRLRDNTRGNGIHTLNANHVFFDSSGNLDLSNALDFIDNNNNWTSTEYDNTNKDNGALDAHWGAEMTYDYFFTNHNRNSIDNNGYLLRNYVHVGNNWENAAWDGERMLYGDGNTTFDILTSIDVIGHEIGHGFCENTANLAYRRESGALNEGLSDIWGSMVENFADPLKDTYLIGEEIVLSGGSLRSMSNPNLRNQPDTYEGDFWLNPECGTPTRFNDYCGVHTNSGVLNFWFYLLAEGGSGINDNNDFYSIDGIDKTKASKIVYRAESVYFTSTTNYHQARNLTIQASDDLYGANSTESYNVANAWYAVGVGNQPQQVSHYISGPTQMTPGTGGFYTLNPYSDATNYVWSIPTGCTYGYCWQIVQGQGTNSALIHGGSTGVFDITCTIYNGSSVIGNQYITVNVQNPYNGGGSTNTDDCVEMPMINGVIYPPVDCSTNNFGLTSENTYFKSIVVYDFVGKIILQLKNSDNLNISNLSNGIYIIKAQLNNGKIITKKILK